VLAAGRHDVVLVSAPLGFQESRRIDVEPGKTTSVHVNPPKAALSVNARPWADVVIDGNSAGQTPISNIDVAIGTHQIVFRNPRFGERRQTVVVTVKGPNRVAVDFSKTN
jgi:PEGA domain-containing protein